MRFLLDTNICSAFLKQPGQLAHRFIQYGGGLATPALVPAELYTWAYRRSNPVPLLKALNEDLLADLDVVDFDRHCAQTFGQLRAALMNSGTVVSPVDLMIASVAVHHDATLVTHNTKDFQRIPDLRIEDWIEGPS